MKGSFEVRVSRKRGTSFKFTIKRNITVVRGNSGTGKTTLYEMIADRMRYGDQSGVTVQCERPCVALTDSDWRAQLAGFTDSIVFIDEGLRELGWNDFAAMVKGSSNYFVLFTREPLASLPYSVNEIYRVKTSGKYHSLVPLYAERDGHRYSTSRALPKFDFDVLLTEDSKSGYQLYSRRFELDDIVCESAGSNAGVLKWLDEHPAARVFVIADGAAFGPYADRVMKLQSMRRDIVTVCLPESFEWLLLRSGVLNSAEVGRILEDPSQYVESAEYMSWEQFFTTYLKQQTAGTPLAYKKDALAEAYMVEENVSKVLALIACRNIK